MSSRELIHRSLAFAFTLTVAGVASARRPPALAEAQEHADGVFATCPQSQARDTRGYRDMLARVQTASPVDRAIAAAPLPPSRKMGDHVVLVCVGGEIHQGSGYRDFPMRFPTEPTTAPQIAEAPRLVVRR